MIDLDQLIADFGRRAVPWEGLVLLGCLLIAYAICWLVGRARRAPDSVLFGRKLVDGALFPMLALALTYTARVAFTEKRKPRWAPASE